MFRQFGGMDTDPMKVYQANSGFQGFVAEQGIDFSAQSKEQQNALLTQYNRAKQTAEATAATKSGVDAEGVNIDGTSSYRMEGPEARTQVSTALMACNSIGSCQKFDSDDIRFELERRGFTNGGSSSKDPSDPTKKADFSMRTTKPELIKMLLNDNKRRAKLARLKGKFDGSLKGARGSFPSESTNPHMYDQKTGLLKEKYLTIDHHGLVAYDIKGDRYRVDWIPFAGYNSKGEPVDQEGTPCNDLGNAQWKRDEEELPFHLKNNLLSGVWELDSRGLPRIEQLNYIDHINKVAKDSKGKYWQVHIARKNKRSNNMDVSNALKNRDGSPKLVWGKYDSKYFASEKVENKAKQFATPMGVFTYDQLMKMPLDNILKMMIVLELADEDPKNTERMMKMGVGPFAPSSGPGLAGRYSNQGFVEGREKTRSTRSMQARVLEEREFANVFKDENGKPIRCGEDGQPAQRCYTDSYIPGTCVPDEKMCFQPRLRKPYENYIKTKFPAGQGLVDRSEGDHQYVTKADIKELYEAGTHAGKTKTPLLADVLAAKRA